MWINRRQSCHKVLFESSNGSLSVVSAMKVGGDKLIFHVIGSEKKIKAADASLSRV
jgi:hypothetical protein